MSYQVEWRSVVDDPPPLDTFRILWGFSSRGYVLPGRFLSFFGKIKWNSGVALDDDEEITHWAEIALPDPPQKTLMGLPVVTDETMPETQMALGDIKIVNLGTL